MKTTTNENIILSVEHLVKQFTIKGGYFSKQKGIVQAVNDISFRLKRNQGLGIVGESGSGKTTVGKCLLRLIEPTSGKVWFDGQDYLNLSEKELFEARKKIQMIYQDPDSSLNPRMKVERIVTEGLEIRKRLTGSERKDIVASILKKVGLPAENMKRYPHEFSGGQRQRIGIARALAMGPELIVADEPVSALDVSVQAQVINLMMDLKDELGLTYVIISHDLAVVQHMCDTIAVMYLGKIMEIADAEQLYESPGHPYSKILLSAVPNPKPGQKKIRQSIVGEIPSPLNPPTGCFLHPRCPHVQDICKQQQPQLEDIGGGHWVACHLPINL
jgi:oligopeptide/dipeptide ABC transporter ATP-binding protein